MAYSVLTFNGKASNSSAQSTKGNRAILLLKKHPVAICGQTAEVKDFTICINSLFSFAVKYYLNIYNKAIRSFGQLRD